MDKYLIITVDTEGDNLWATKNPDSSVFSITNENGKYIERFQLLCEKYGFIPTYLTNYEMALSKPFVKMAKTALVKKNCEVGMHLHAFNNPPKYDLKDRGGRNKAYAGEYPDEVLEEKISYITSLLKETFETDITSHRGGRWYLSETYLKLLEKQGYLVDCTVTPGVDWTANTGQTRGSKGVDYSFFPRIAYRISLDDMSKRGDSSIVEVPVTISKKNIKEKLREKLPYSKRGKLSWLRPNGNNLNEMIGLVKASFQEKRDYIEFMIHSSELMPGGSPTFQTEERIEKLYSDMESLFAFVEKDFNGISLSDYGKTIL